MSNNLTKNVQYYNDGTKLTPLAISFLESCLQEVGEYGEIHLVVENGKLRFVRTVKSINFRPVAFNGES